MTDPATSPISELLERRRKQLVAELLAGSDAARFGEYLSLEEAIATLRQRREPENQIYAGYRQPIDAIIAHLDRVQRFLPREELEEAVLAGGFGPEEERRQNIVRDSIRHQITKGTRLTVNREGLIGLPEWISKRKRT